MVTAAENRRDIDALKKAHEKCQTEVAQGWPRHALLVMKAIEDLEAAQKRTNNRIWALVVAVLFALLGVVLSFVKQGFGG